MVVSSIGVTLYWISSAFEASVKSACSLLPWHRQMYEKRGIIDGTTQTKQKLQNLYTSCKKVSLVEISSSPPFPLNDVAGPITREVVQCYFFLWTAADEMSV